jgi:arylsulfatase A-like enzyme
MRRGIIGLLLAASGLTGACSPAGDADGPAGALHLADILAFEDGVPVSPTRATLLGVGREAIAVRGPAVISASVRVPEGGRLHFAIAAAGDSGTAAEVAVGSGRRFATVWNGRASRRDGWLPASVDLSGHAGREVRIRFVAAGDDSLLWGSPVLAGAKPAHRDIVLHELDTLRADLLGAYGCPEPTSPELDALARRGVQFLDCTATATWTRPSATSILTSLSAPTHGVVWENSSLAGDVVTLAQILRDRGWYTVAFQPNPNAGRPVGLDRGFDEVYEMGALLREAQRHPESFGGLSLSSSSASGTTELIAFLLRRRIPDWAGLPLFLYVHPTDPHSPYDPRAPFSAIPGLDRPRPDRETAENLAAYSRDVRAADHFLRRILRSLGLAGRLDRAVVAFLSDHGEEFGERGGRGHGRNLHDETLRVPLVLRAPGALPAGVLHVPRVSTLDVMPTLLDLAGLEAPPGLEGSSLVAAAGRPAAAGAGEEPDFAHVIGIGVRMRKEADDNPDLIGQIAVLEGRWKCVVLDNGRRRRPRARLFDRVADPGETRDVAAEHPETAARLEAMAWAWYDERRGVAHAAETEGDMDPELLEQLRALGYAH